MQLIWVFFFAAIKKETKKSPLRLNQRASRPGAKKVH